MTDQPDTTTRDAEALAGSALFRGILDLLQNAHTASLATDVLAVAAALGYHLAISEVDPEVILPKMTANSVGFMQVIVESYREAMECIAAGELRLVALNPTKH